MSQEPFAWPGQKISLTGQLKKNVLKNGFETKVYLNITNPDIKEITMPSSRQGLASFLEAFPGIGKKTAERISVRFGSPQDIDTAIQSGPNNALSSMTGKSRYEKFVKAWEQRNQTTSPAILFMRSLKISVRQSQTILKKYGEGTERIIRSNPYELMGKIRGFAFDRCDKIAEELGIPPDMPIRVTAAIANVVKTESIEKGHCYLTTKQLFNGIARAGIPKDLAESTLETFPSNLIQKMSINGETVWTLPRLFKAEKQIADNIRDRLAHPPKDLDATPEKILERSEERLKIPMNIGQKQAFTTILASPMAVLTGDPGTGKTHLLNAITKSLIQLCGWNKDEIILVSPTGRGAVNMTLSTKLEASTIASLLQIAREDENESFFSLSEDAQNYRDKLLNARLLVCDETSMADTITMARLLKAIPKTCRILFVGDPEQLLPVGPGNPFLSIIKSRCIPVCTLWEPKRQERGEQESLIVKVAKQMKEGIIPDMSNPNPNADWMFIRTKENTDILSRIVDIASRRLTKSYNYDPKNDIQVISPQKTGPLGTQILNENLREAITPDTGEKTFSDLNYRQKEKIMQIANNWEIETPSGKTTNIANGEIGILEKIHSNKDGEETATAKFPREKICYNKETIQDTALAYAVSTHKMQGSEYPAIIFPMTTSQTFMLSRRMVRTALTRARKHAIFVGQPDALIYAIKKSDDDKRNNMLDEMLQGNYPVTA